jgi:chromosome segregation ATPase
MSNEQPHDPTVTLRLELGRVTDQRDAYQSALRKEVLAVIRDASTNNERMIPIRPADQAVAACEAELQRFRAENARLKADFSQMTAWGRGLESDLSRARVELMLVKAEVERLTAFTTRTIIPNEELKAQVERLQNRCDFLEGKGL